MQPDLHLTNAHIITQYDAQPRAVGLLIRAGRVLALLDADEAIPGVDRLDLGGRTVIPGLTDAHVHLSWYASLMQEVKLKGARSAEECVERAAKRAA
ncbi:MAG: amidohydrolase family protein, partial [Anaerolineae bacterium]